jgi:hypothetical protein
VSEGIVERGKAAIEPVPHVPGLGPLVGGHVPKDSAKPGAYAMQIGARQHRFITMEHTISDSIDGGAVLTLRDDRSVEACVWWTLLSTGSIGKYASKTGKATSTESEQTRRTGARGQWREDTTLGAVVVTLDRVAHGNCEVSPGAVASPAPIQLSCWAVPAGGQLPVDATACRIDTDWDAGEKVAMLLVDTERAGSWALREDLAHRDELDAPADARPWLLLSPTPGVRIRHDDDRSTSPLRVELSALPPTTKLPPPL